jgi:hypothetical protein
MMRLSPIQLLGIFVLLAVALGLLLARYLQVQWSAH